MKPITAEPRSTGKGKKKFHFLLGWPDLLRYSHLVSSPGCSPRSSLNVARYLIRSIRTNSQYRKPPEQKSSSQWNPNHSLFSLPSFTRGSRQEHLGDDARDMRGCESETAPTRAHSSECAYGEDCMLLCWAAPHCCPARVGTFAAWRSRLACGGADTAHPAATRVGLHRGSCGTVAARFPRAEEAAPVRAWLKGPNG
jgi:hypothetical protein